MMKTASTGPGRSSILRGRDHGGSRCSGGSATPSTTSPITSSASTAYRFILSPSATVILGGASRFAFGKRGDIPTGTIKDMGFSSISGGVAMELLELLLEGELGDRSI